MLRTQCIKQIPTNNNQVFAFEISGKLSESDLEAMGSYMNDVFGAYEDTDLLLKFHNYEGAEFGAALNTDMVKAQFKALSKVNTYAVVGAPDNAAALIDFLSPIIPVESKTYPKEREQDAWLKVGAAPVG